MPRIRFDFGTLTLEAELLDTPTAKAVLAKLPYDARVMTWGEEVYFDVPVEAAREKDARAVVTRAKSPTGPTGRASRSAMGARRSRQATKRGSPARAIFSETLSATRRRWPR